MNVTQTILGILGSRTIAFNATLARALGGNDRALFLQQIIFHCEQTEDGWAAVTQDQLKEETNLSRYEQLRCRDHLIKEKIIEERKNVNPARLLYRVNGEMLTNVLGIYFTKNSQTKNENGAQTESASFSHTRTARNSQTPRAPVLGVNRGVPVASSGLKGESTLELKNDDDETFHATFHNGHVNTSDLFQSKQPDEFIHPLDPRYTPTPQELDPSRPVSPPRAGAAETFSSQKDLARAQGAPARDRKPLPENGPAQRIVAAYCRAAGIDAPAVYGKAAGQAAALAELFERLVALPVGNKAAGSADAGIEWA